MQNGSTHPRARLSRLYRWLSFYPPFMTAGIHVSYRPPDFDVRMSLTWFNRNAVGTHFGGSLYAMCDAFYMLILLQALGDGYIVWDKSASIEFLRPGKGTVFAHFHIPEPEIVKIRKSADAGEKVEPVFCAEVKDKEGQVVARVEKRLYVRKRQDGQYQRR